MAIRSRRQNSKERITRTSRRPKLRWNDTPRPDLRPDRKFFLKCCFESTAVPHAPATRSRRLWRALTVGCLQKFGQRKNADFIGVFVHSKFCVRKFFGHADREVRSRATARHGARRWNPEPNSPTPILKWSRCFFRCAVVIRVQCGRFATALSDIATHSILGGQHGEESKGKDQISGKEDRAQDREAQEEEVTRWFGAIGSDLCRRHLIEPVTSKRGSRAITADVTGSSRRRRA